MRRGLHELSVMFTAWMLLVIPAADPLVAAQTNIDAGNVFIGQPLVRRFSLRNNGPNSLTVTGVQASCGCAAPTLSRRTLGSGESAELALDVNTLSQPAGPVRWSATVNWRAGQTEGRTVLELTAQLIREIDIEPASLAFVAAPGLCHEIVLTDRRPKPLAITGVRTDTPGLRAELLPNGRVRVGVTDSCPEGVTADTLRIATDDPKYPELRVPVTVNRKPAAKVTAVPARVTLAGGSVLVQLRGADAPIQIERIEAGHPALTARWAPGPGSFATLRIGIDRSKWDGRELESEVKVWLVAPVGAR